MNWWNLKKNRCPACGGDLIIGMEQTTGGLIYCSCGFKISPKRMKEIVTSQVAKGLSKDLNEEKHYRPDDENNEG